MLEKDLEDAKNCNDSKNEESLNLREQIRKAQNEIQDKDTTISSLMSDLNHEKQTG